MQKSPIPIACDHGGFEMKEYIKKKLQDDGYEVIDYGTNSSDRITSYNVCYTKLLRRRARRGGASATRTADNPVRR